MDEGSYKVDEVSYDLKSSIQYLEEHTTFYPPDSELAGWNNHAMDLNSDHVVQISAQEITTLQGTRYLADLLASSPAETRKIGVLNFASAKNPGGGFLKGAQAQVSVRNQRNRYRLLFNLLGRVSGPFVDSLPRSHDECGAKVLHST